MRVNTLSLQLMLQCMNQLIMRMKIVEQSLNFVITMQYFFILSLALVGLPNNQVRYSRISTSLQGLMDLFHSLDILALAMVIFCSMLAMIANSLMYFVSKNPTRLTYPGRQGTRSILPLNSSHITHGSDIIDQTRSPIPC